MTAAHRSRIACAWLIGAAALATLSGCFPLVATGIATTALVADDRRTAGIMVEDESIENKTQLRIEQKHGANSHVNVTSYNRIVLLTGEVQSAAIREDIERIARGVENVRSVNNEVTVAQTTTMMLRG